MSVWQVTHKAVFLAQQIRNTFYYNTTVGDPSASEWQDIADEIRADFVAELQTYLSTAYSLYGIDYRLVGQSGYPSFSRSFTSGTVAGGSATDPLPTQIALLVSNKGNTTKPNKGRSYLSGWTEAAVTASLFTASYIGAAEAFIDLQSTLNAGGTNPLSRVAAQWNTAHTQVIATNSLATAVSVGSIVPATQRRRRIGVGI